MKIRTECPKNNKYYIRRATGGLNAAVAGYPMQKYADVLDNCVGGANGRFNEIINDPELKGIEKPFKYQLVCDAEDFIESAKKQGLKISSTPVEGGIMVWRKGATLSPSDGAGHVAVVERVYDDGTILTSESGWASWAWKTVKRDNENGRWGQNENYTFRGCIKNPSIKNPKVVPVPPLSVDGVGGTCTIRAMQRYFGTPQDGVISGQNKSLKKYYPSIKSVEYGSGGSACVKKLQKWCDVTADGVLGEKTIKAWQKKLGVTADGIFGANSMKAWQKFLNKQLFGDTTDSSTKKPSTTPTTTPTASVYKVIDVSDWQSQIDWAKVKADGVIGAIIRYADGNTLDKRFTENMKNAKANGIHIGSYIFSRAKTKAEAEKEAERLYNACKPYSPDMPLYIDLEVTSLSKYANTVAQAFLNKMAKLGGRGGVYANLNWWNNYLVDTAKNFNASPFWIAQYNDKMTHKEPSLFGMWQYTSSGKVNGISGKVDMNKCYVAYWNNAPKNDPPKEEPPKEEPTEEPVKDEVAADPLQPWYDALKEQYEWSKDQKYNFNTHPTVENSEEEGTCITFVAVALQRLGLLPKKKWFWLYPKTKKIDGNGDDYVKNHPEIYEVSYPWKTIADLWKEGKIKKGDIVGFDDPDHTMVFKGFNAKNEPIFDTMGHKRGLNVTYPSYAKRKVGMIVRLKKVVK